MQHFSFCLQHEDATVAMFDHLLTENDLKTEMLNYGLDEKDRIFIEEQIAGPFSPENWSEVSVHSNHLAPDGENKDL